MNISAKSDKYKRNILDGHKLFNNAKAFIERVKSFK